MTGKTECKDGYLPRARVVIKMEDGTTWVSDRTPVDVISNLRDGRRMCIIYGDDPEEGGLLYVTKREEGACSDDGREYRCLVCEKYLDCLHAEEIGLVGCARFRVSNAVAHVMGGKGERL